MFKPFFEEDADQLDNRGTVILHELAHVIGLNSEKELNDIKSAESLRNFILLVTKKVSKEALLESIKNAPPKLKLSTSVLAYSPDQPRDPKGTPTGGQWSSDDNNSSNQNGKSEDDSKTSKSDKETQSEETKEEKSEENEADGQKAQDVSNKSMSYSTPKAIISDAENKSEVTYKVNEENGAVRVSFTTADKSAEQNQGREDSKDKKDFIQNKTYTKDPSEAILVNRNYGKQSGLYANTTVRFDGLKKNTDYTIPIEATYEYTEQSGSKYSKKVLVFYDVKSDNNGTIILERIAPLEKNDKDTPLDKRVDEIVMALTFYLIEGRVNDCLDSSQAYTQNIDNDISNLNNPENKHIANPLISHAKTGKYDDNGNIQEDNQGGAAMANELVTPDAEYLFELNIKSKR